MKPYQHLPLAILLILLVSFNSLSANWFVATSTPPMSNVAAPINTSTTTQEKKGNFMAHVVAAASSTWSPRYCDELGNNCFEPGTLSGGGWVAANQQIYSGSIAGSGTGDTGGVDLNLASIVGARETLVQLQVTTPDNTSNSFVFKPKGVAGVQGSTVGSGVGAGAAGLQLFGTANRMGYVTVTTNAAGIILMQAYTTQNVTVRLVGYIGGQTSASSSGNGGGNGGSIIQSIFASIGTSTFTVPAGVSQIFVEVGGGGGGGGNSQRHGINGQNSSFSGNGHNIVAFGGAGGLGSIDSTPNQHARPHVSGSGGDVHLAGKGAPGGMGATGEYQTAQYDSIYDGHPGNPGGAAFKSISVVPGQTYSVVIGAGGAGVPGSSNGHTIGDSAAGADGYVFVRW